MNIAQYLSPFDAGQEITLVGPMLPTDYRRNDFAEPLLYVDGGVDFRIGQNGIVVGDGDSAKAQMDIKLNPHKDLSDLAFVLSEIPVEFCVLNLFGFLGGRRDHEWFNFGEVSRFLSIRAGNGIVRFDDSVVGYSAGKWCRSHAGEFSLAVLEPANIRLTGDCKYQCDPGVAFSPLSSLGLSNVASGTIYMETNAPTFLFLLDETKPGA